VPGARLAPPAVGDMLPARSNNWHPGVHMKLYFCAASPYTRKARVTAIEAGLAAKIEMVEINPWTDPAGYRDLNPIGKVPTLVPDDGPALFESAIIC